MHLQVAPFAPAVTREFTPYKPHPAGLLHICAAWDVHPSEVLMIGDSAKDDVRSPPPFASAKPVPLQASADRGALGMLIGKRASHLWTAFDPLPTCW